MQRYVVSQREYQPLAGLPGWLTAKCDERFRGGIVVNEHDVHVRKVFDITEPALIEHRHGYVFLGSGLVRESMTYWQLDSGPTPKAYRDYLAWRACPKAVLHLPEALSLRGRWENNFWHFHDNVLSKLIAGDELGLSPDIPLLVGKGLWDTRWFAEIKALPDAAGSQLGLTRASGHNRSADRVPRGFVPRREHAVRGASSRDGQRSHVFLEGIS